VRDKQGGIPAGGQDMRVIGEVRCLNPGLAGIRALRVVERAGG
jgi:hypothetical protein